MKFARLSLVTLGFLTIFVGPSCAQQNSSPSSAPATAAPVKLQSRVTTQPGVAGGVLEEVLTIQVVVTAVDLPTRHVTRTGPEGKQITFTAGPEIRNLPQLKANDKVTATFTRRMVVVVRASGDVGASYTAAGATAQPGDKPGMLLAEEATLTAKVKTIDIPNRMAGLEFVDGTVENIPVRPDVDMTKYKVGDVVTIRVTNALTVLTGA